jgi:DNA uptake protein ComE-like DNA-binding protein
MSVTPGERRALLWVLAVAVVGTGVKVHREWRHAGAVSPGASEALRRQLVAVDSAQRDDRARRSSGRGRRSARTRPVTRRLTDSTRPADVAGEVAATRRRRRSADVELPTLPTVDLDQADSAALERLPRIGPALAARIVADRRAKGPFGSLAVFQRVRGVGPKLAQALAPRVTFSGTPRPSSVWR